MTPEVASVQGDLEEIKVSYVMIRLWEWPRPVVALTYRPFLPEVNA